MPYVLGQRPLGEVEIGLGKGKKDHDKREDTKQREWAIEKARDEKQIIESRKKSDETFSETISFRINIKEFSAIL